MFREPSGVDSFARLRDPGDLEFFSLSRDPVCVVGRQLVNSWLAGAPEDLRETWTPRLAAGESFSGAVFELYVWRYMSSMGLTVTAAPVLPGGSWPDLLVEVGSHQFVVECKVIGDSPDSNARLRELFRSASRKSRSRGFLVWIEDAETTPLMPSAKELLRHVDPWLASLDHAAIIARNATEFRDLPGESFLLARSGWKISCRAVPMKDEAAKPESLWAGGPVTTSWVESGRLKEAVREKRRQHASLSDLPMVVCLSVADRELGMSDTLMLENLLGPSVVRYDLSGQRPPQEYRKPTGLFTKRDSKTAESVAGVLACGPVRPWAFGEVAPAMWINPRVPSAAETLSRVWKGRTCGWDLTSGEHFVREGECASRLLGIG